MQLFKQGLRGALFVLFLIANPAYFVACTGADDGQAGDADYQYDEEDMRSVLGDVNASDWSADGYAFQFQLAQSSGALATLAPGGVRFIQSAHACGNRTFVASASACIDTSEMAVSGTVTIFHIHDDSSLEELASVEVEGALIVDGLTMASMQLDLAASEGSLRLGSNGGDALTLNQVSLNDPEQGLDIAYEQGAL